MCYSTPYLSTNVQWSSTERPYWTDGRPEKTNNEPSKRDRMDQREHPVEVKKSHG